MTHGAAHPDAIWLNPLRWRFFLFIALCALAVMVAPAAAAPPTPKGAGTPNLLIFELHLDRAILADALIVYEAGNDLLLPLGELTRLLTLGITIDPDARVASGFVLSEERVFRLDLATQTVTLASGRESFDSSQVRWLDDDIYVASRLLQGWLPLNLYIDLSTLVMDVVPREKLPLQYRLERERTAQALRRRGGPYLDPGYPRAAPDYQLLSVPFIDQTLGFDYQWGPTATTNWAYSAYLTGDLLGMEGSLYLATSKNDDTLDPRLTLSRNDPEGALLGPLQARSLILGSMGVPALNNVLRGSGSGNGILLSNRPLTQSASYGLHTLRGDLLPGWDVTLYFNDALIAFQQSRPDGLYEFADQSLIFGVNEFRLIFNGPLGQTRVERQLFILDQTLTKPGEFVYTLAGQRDDNGRRRASTQFDFGLANRLAFSGGMISTPLTTEGEERRFYNLGLRTALLGMLMNGDYVRAEAGGSLYELGVKTRLGRYALDLTHTGLSEDFVSDFFPVTPDQVKLRDRARLSGALPLGKKLHLPVALDFTREESRGGTLTLDLQGRISMNLRGTNFTNALSWNQRGESTSSVGIMQLRRRVAGIGLNSQVAYLLAPETRITSLALSGDKNFGQASRLSLGVQHLLDPDQTTFSAGVTHNFGRFGLGLNGRYGDTGEYAAGIQLFMALGREPRSGAWVADWQPLAGSGAVSACVFLDANQNGAFDPGEQPIEGAGFTMNEGSRHPVSSNADGLAYLTRLPPRQYADIALDIATLEDPQWLPAVKGMRILPRPGKVQSLDFPVVMTGEVDGTVYLQEDGKRRGIGNALVELVNEQGAVVASARSASDGYYVLPAVRPGHYKAMIFSPQLEELGLASTAPMELTMRADGEFIYGLDFTLQSKPTAVTAGFVQAATGEEFVVESLTFCRLGTDCNAMKTNLRRCSYEPTLIPISTMHLQRLRLGPFTGKKLKEVLAFARSIEPGSYSVPVDGSYVIHAGAYLMQGYIDKQVRLFASKGIEVQLEAVEVVSPLHRVRFGSFATQAEAGAAAHAVSACGMQVEVVKLR